MGLFSALAMASADDPGNTPIHFTRAQMLQQEGGSLGPPPAQVDSSGPAGAWSEVELPHVSLDRSAKSTVNGGDITNVVTTWYRISLDTGFPGSQPADIGLYLPRWKTVGQVAVYGDGRLLFHSLGGPVWNGFNHPLWLPLADTAGAALPRTLLIRLSSVRAAGGAISSAWVGPQEGLVWRYRLRSWLQNSLPEQGSAALLALGLFSLAVWAVRRRESIYGLFFAASLMFYVRCLHYHWGSEPLPVPEDWFGWATVNSIGWFLLTVYFFGFRLHGRTYPWLERGYLALISTTTLIMLPPLKAVPMAVLLAPMAYLAMLLGAIVLVCTAVWAAWRARSRDALILALFNLTVLPMSVHDLLLQSYKVSMESVYLLAYEGIGTFIIFLVIASRRYIGALAEVEQSHAQLEQRLSESKAELAQSYERLRVIEEERVLSQERQRLMQDMHDGMGSSLISALRMAEEGQLGESQVAPLLRECIDDLRLTIDSLEPVQTDLLLVLATLRFRVGKRLQGAGMQLHWEVQDVPSLVWLDPRTALHILRILQEVFTNIVKHAQASEIRVSTASNGDDVMVSINDNGIGLPADARQRGGKGLDNLQRRAQAVGARLHWQALTPGTRFELWLPLQAPASRAI